MIKRFGVMNLDPSGLWEPSTLVVETSSSRSETLSFHVTSTRGRGSLLARGEVWAERRRPEQSIKSTPVPRGHEVIEFRLVASEAQAKLDVEAGTESRFLFATIVGDEVLQGLREMRRGKPRTPTPKMSDDEIWQCRCCGARVMARGSENAGWKGVQMKPTVPVHTYFCTNPPCKIELGKAIEIAKVNWGYDSTVDAAPENQPPPPEGGDVPKYGPPAPKPFL